VTKIICAIIAMVTGTPGLITACTRAQADDTGAQADDIVVPVTPDTVRKENRVDAIFDCFYWSDDQLI